MEYDRIALPGIFVQSINRILDCPFDIMIQPDKAYPPKVGVDEKFYVRITTKTIALRNHCEKLLRALDLRVVRFATEETKLHCQVFASEIKKIHEALPKPTEVCASNLEKYLQKIFKEVKFSSALTDVTVEYIATVNQNNIRTFLQVLTNLGIDDWEAVDNNTAIAFTLARIQDF